jgi:hypothetical protein
VVALDLDRAVPHRPATTATLLELLGQLFELGLRQRQTGNDRDALAAAALSFATNPYHRFVAARQRSDDCAGQGTAFGIDIHGGQFSG